ncbi:MAG TPA: DNA-directed DNA polymerase [Candidatus Acidoferrales bacterium]|nr:DNA-directed DNA polymerase [Candidatus Acidoferrales bacterium]
MPKNSITAEAGSGKTTQIDAMLLEVDYLTSGEETLLRLTVKARDGKVYEIFDREFKPYFYLAPAVPKTIEEIAAVSAMDMDRLVRPAKVEKETRQIMGTDTELFKIFAHQPSNVPKLSSALSQYGTCYEYDIPFAKRYSVDNELMPLAYYKMSATETGGALFLDSIEGQPEQGDFSPNVMCFDIEVYNPLTVPRAEIDPVIMISYLTTTKQGTLHKLITWKDVGNPDAIVVKDEKAMFREFVKTVNDLDIDIIVGYNSANFDIKYLLDRARALKIDFNLSRSEGPTKIERHGLVDKVKIGGRAHVDMYLVVRFVAIVGASENILKLNRYTLKSVYEAITGTKQFIVDATNIHEMWDGDAKQLQDLARYSLADAESLRKVYESFITIMVELSRVSYNVLSDVCVSTTGQLVEFMLMRYARKFNEIIPNKPDEYEIKRRLGDPIEGAYVKTPEPGIYDNLVMFDFRGLYPSIIISYNIDPSSICKGCTDYFESPTGARFDKKRKSTTPTILKLLIEQRTEVKKAYKKDPSNIFLGSRSQALKILSNSFYGYLGYARSRWYSKDCAASVTAYGRQYIKEVMASSEKSGMSVVYGDTDSLLMLLGNKTKDDASKFMKDYNSTLPESMELELEDFYTRGVFVGKRAEKGEAGAKKKYALIAENGRIKIRGFELVRRDWSRVARDTQRAVLETILKEGDAQKAADIVKDVVTRLKSGLVPLSDVVISTQLRKGLSGYDIKSPELAAAKKAVESGFRKKEEVEHTVIGYIITKHGSTISDKAEIEGMAKDYDPDYYINKQVIPATMRILKELNFNEEELKGLGSQKKL